MKSGMSCLRIARQRKKLTQTELAEILHVHPVSISRWEHGVRTPSLPMIQKIAWAMGMSVVELLAIQ